MTTPSKGLNTWIGYLTALVLGLSAGAAAALNVLDVTSVPAWVVIVLTLAAGASERITGLSRVSQANEMVRANGSSLVTPAVPPRVVAVSDVGPSDPGDLDGIDLSDAELLPSQEG